MVDSKELGKLKLEHEVKQGIFISGKIYWFMTKDGKIINRAKGINSSSLSYDDYASLLHDKNVYTAKKKQSKIDWSIGHVVIEEKDNITINSNNYTKRVKIHSDEVWVDTKPVFINNIDKSLIPYNTNTNKSLLVLSNPIEGIHSSSYINSLKETKEKDIVNSSPKYTLLFNLLVFSISLISSLAYLANISSNEDSTEDITLTNDTSDIVLPSLKEENTEEIIYPTQYL